MSYVLGIDIGGTFTDCVAVETDRGAARASHVEIGKASSTPPDFETGFVDSISTVASRYALTPSAMLGSTTAIYHGCTVGTNALVEGRTAKVGLLSTRGHRDAIFIMQGGGRLSKEPPEYIAHVASHRKSDPLVPKDLCMEIDERIAFDGSVLVTLNEDRARRSIEALVERGVEAFAVALLWSTVDPRHEHRLRALIEEIAPGAFISLSSEVSQRHGEYERTVATVMNSLVGPAMNAYLRKLEVRLEEHGYRGPLQLMGCSGGLMSVEQARVLPVLTIGSGPVAGLIGSAAIANLSSASYGGDIITGDMGGTSYDVGMIVAGEPVTRATVSYEQYEYYAPTLEVRSIGAGGGSIVKWDGPTLRVGPESAGARPGPVCYGRGGEKPTVTDADLVLGYLNPDYFLGARLKLDVDGARAAYSKLGDPMGYGPEQAAAAAVRIVENQMADAIRLATIHRGYDVRDFTLYAYGGAGPVHATGVARELDLQRVIVPLSNFASGWSAFGIAASDAIVIAELGAALASPFDAETLNDHWRHLEDQAQQKMSAQGISANKVSIERFVDMRYTLQVNEIQVRAAPGHYTSASVDTLVAAFEREYERLFGSETGYADAGFTISGLRVRAAAPIGDVPFMQIAAASNGARPGGWPTRRVTWYEMSEVKTEDVPIISGEALAQGVEVDGPAVIEYPDTTVVLRPGDAAHVSDIGLIVDVTRKQDGGRS